MTADMAEMQAFSMWLLEEIPDFLWSVPIRYLVSLMLLLFVVGIFKKIIKF